MEEFCRFRATHFQYIINVFTIVFNGERFFVVATPLTGFTGHPDIWKEMHFDANMSVPSTFLTAPSGHIEAKPSSGVAADF